jgi:hypothetical protein
MGAHGAQPWTDTPRGVHGAATRASGTLTEVTLRGPDSWVGLTLEDDTHGHVPLPACERLPSQTGLSVQESTDWDLLLNADWDVAVRSPE